jgi:hypothetical protein
MREPRNTLREKCLVGLQVNGGDSCQHLGCFTIILPRKEVPTGTATVNLPGAFLEVEKKYFVGELFGRTHKLHCR